jgi:hypothetical protein
MGTLSKKCEVHCKLPSENQKETVQLEDLRVEGRIILIRIIKKRDSREDWIYMT